MLKNNNIFSQFSETFLDKLTHYFQEITFAPDDSIKVVFYFVIKDKIITVSHVRLKKKMKGLSILF